MNNLKQLGLTGYEIKVYEAVVRQPQSTATEISAYSKVPPTAVYPALKSLENKKLITVFKNEQANTYEANDIKLALTHYSKSLIQRIQEAREQATAKLQEIHQEPIVKNKEVPVKISLGKETSIELFETMAQQATKSFQIMGWKFSHKTNIFDVFKTIRQLRKQEVKVQMIFTERNKKTKFFVEECKKIQVDCKFKKPEQYSIIIADEKCSKLTIKDETVSERVNINILNNHLSKGFASWFNSLWNESEEF